MGYRWKPNASQRAAFRERMSDPLEQQAYEQRKAEKRLYENWKDKDFVPTKEQYEFCFEHGELFETHEQTDARNFVCSGWVCQEKVPHCYIHIVNELRRNNI